MKIYPRQEKGSRQEGGNYYFGNYGEIDLGISVATIFEDNKDQPGDKLHHHIKSNEYYIVLEGEGVMQVGDQEIVITPETTVMVEPYENHKILRATKTPFRFIAISTKKERDDKVVME